jgi:hypothetical protein
MANVSIALLSAAEFEVARRMMLELSEHSSYDDWVDCRYGALMGRSLGGDDASLVTVGLGPFLEWCDDRGVDPTEGGLDAFARHLAGERTPQAVQSSAASRLFTHETEASISLRRRPKRASRSLGADL